MSRRERKKSCNKFRAHQQRKSSGEVHLRLVKTNQEAIEQQQSPRLKKVTITPKNDNQKHLLNLLSDYNVDVVLAIGPAGTGKTLISTLVGIQEFKFGDVGKIVITRPAVGNDEDIGFLPGSIQEKMAPWTRPLLDIFDQYYSPQHMEVMLQDNKIEMAPLGMMRGRTFHNCWIIADEMQLSTTNQFKMLLTRIGEGSKLVITGDLAQADRDNQNNGLKDFLFRYQKAGGSDRIKIVHFTKDDVERHPVVQEVLDIYEE